MGNKTRSKHQDGLYQSYKASKRQETNRKRKLTRLAKEQPNNEQIAAALKNIKYRRCTPKASHWSHTAIHYAMLLKSFSKRKAGFTVPNVSSKDMGKLFMRAHDEQGALVWNPS